MAQSTGAHPYPPSDDSFDDWYEVLPTCPAMCVGHLDRSTDYEHTSPLDEFGPDGIAVIKRDGRPAKVSLRDFNPRTAVFSPARARLFAQAVIEAANVAERYPREPLAAAAP